MKLSDWAKRQTLQTWLMLAAIAMLLILLATRWDYISRTAGDAFRRRFTPPTEQTDSSARQADPTPERQAASFAGG